MNKQNTLNILLASASSRRLDLLRQINITPKAVIPADIDEKPYKNELPHKLALRLSQGKAEAVHQQNPNNYVLGADTVVACGKKILDKAENADQARKYLEKLQGRRHQVHGGITLITPNGQILSRSCKTLVQFAPLSTQDIDLYIENGEWEDKAGGYAIQGYAASFIKYISGSYSNVVGLSLYDTMKLIERAASMPSK